MFNQAIRNSAEAEPLTACRTFVLTVADKNLTAAKAVQALCRANKTIVLAAITLFALLLGWLGGSVTQSLPPSAVLVCAVIAYVAGGYTGIRSAVEQ